MQQRSSPPAEEPSVAPAAATAGAGQRPRCGGTAMGSITLDLRPGFGIGPFTIGMSIREAFSQVEHQPNIYDVVHVKYYDEGTLKLDTVISFPDHGFHLRFHPWSLYHTHKDHTPKKNGCAYVIRT